MKLVKHRVSGEIFDLDDVDQGMVRCRQSGEFFDPDETTSVAPNVTIGCGLRERDFIACDGCVHEHDKAECSALREKKNLSLTVAADLVKKIE